MGRGWEGRGGGGKGGVEVSSGEGWRWEGRGGDTILNTSESVL